MKFGDIIQPSDRLGEKVFTERWSDRKAVRSVQHSTQIKVRGQSKRHDDEFRRTFTSLYREGMPYKRMAVELGIAKNSVWRFAKAYGLPQRIDRIDKPLGRGASIGIKINVTEAMDREITAHLRKVGRSRSAWIRRLMRIDMDRRP